MKVLICLFLAGCVAETLALFSECPGQNFGELEKAVKVSNCKRTYCKLKKKYSISVEFNFKSAKEVPKVHNTISARVAGIPFPFIGVDGADAKGNIFEEGGEKQAEFPLKADTTYVYKNQINVLPVYPTLKTVVHWALTGPDGDLMCFEVPARIVN